MEIIKGENADDLFINIAKTMLDKGHINAPRGQKTIELNNVWLELANPLENIVNIPERKIDLEYLNEEMKWYLSGDLSVDNISQHASMWDRLKDSNGTVNSNYGFIVFKDKFAGKSQYEWCIDSLKNDANSRQALINYNQPKHKYNGNKDFVCTISQQFIKQNDKLDSIVLMRSNDLIYGLTYDLPWFTYLHEKVSNEVGMSLGIYSHYAASLHVYEKHFKMLENISKSEGKK